MNRYKAGGPSKATPTTICQKCLQRGHYSYECTRAHQDRPYVSRPSRSQQLLNPKLAPKIKEAAPEVELKGQESSVEKISESRKRSIEEDERLPRKRSRSASTSSSGSDSVSTISTNSSRSRSAHRRREHTTRDEDSRALEPRTEDLNGRRRTDPHGESDTESRRYRQRDRHRERSLRRSRSASVNRSRFRVKRDRRAADSRSRSPEAEDHFHRQTRPRKEHSTGPANMNNTETRDARRDTDRRRSSQYAESRRRSLSPYSKRVALTTLLDERR